MAARRLRRGRHRRHLLGHGRASPRPRKRDFSFMGKFLFVGMIALLIAMIANMFLQIPALALTISTLVIVVFSLFLLYDLQPHRERRRDELRDGDDRRLSEPLQHLRQPAAPAAWRSPASGTNPVQLDRSRTRAPRGRPFHLRLTRLEERDALDVRGVREHVDHARGREAEALHVAPARRRRARASPDCTTRRRCAAATPSGSALTISTAPSRGGSISSLSKGRVRR